MAGPIERTENLLPQIKRENIFDYGQASYGLKLMAWGFFKNHISQCLKSIKRNAYRQEDIDHKGTVADRKLLHNGGNTFGKLMAWGFFKKIVVADTLAVYVDTVYNNLQNYKGMVLAIATVTLIIKGL